MEQLHKYEFTLLIAYVISGVLRAHFHLYASSTTWVWLLIHPNTPSFHLSFAHFLTTFLIRLSIPHLIVSHLSRYHWWFGYPFAMSFVQEWAHYIPSYVSRYCCIYRIGEWSLCTKKGFSPFPCHTRRQVDIMITNNFCTLADVVITNPTHTNLVQCASMTRLHIVTIVVQNKAWSYKEQTLGDDFIPLAIETYDYLHPRFDSFFTSYVHICIARHQ
jgi:hypothetical protein